MSLGSSSSERKNNQSRGCLGNVDELRLVFDQYDKNKDGRISREELRDVLSSFGGVSLQAAQREAEAAMAEIDKDGDGYIDIDEFTNLILSSQGCQEGNGGDELKDAFDLYDLDGNGVISAKELHSVMKKLGHKCTLSDCRKMISSVDRDGDGNVNFEEFKTMMTDNGNEYSEMAQMSQASRLAVQVDITCSAEKFYGMFRKNIGQLVQMYPENIKSYKFYQGNEFGNGAIVIWNYNLGTPSTAKVRHDTNDATKTITLTVLEGDVLKTFKSFKAKLQVERGVAKWSIEFEKINPNTSNPNEYLDFINKVSKGLNTHLGKA